MGEMGRLDLVSLKCLSIIHMFGFLLLLLEMVPQLCG